MNTFPELEQLELPEPVKIALLKHLTEPFQTLSEAKAYWEENSVQLGNIGTTRKPRVHRSHARWIHH